MDISKMKNIIVLKNLPSNIIEEAFVVLKANKKIKSLKTVKEKNVEENQKIKEKEHIVKEAEMVISNYISETDKTNQLKLKSTRDLERKYKKSKTANIFLGVLTVFLIVTQIM